MKIFSPRNFLTVSLMVLMGSVSLFGQGTLEDYNRTYAMSEKFSASKVPNFYMRPQWIGDTHKFFYINETPTTKTYTVVDADKRSSKVLFDHKNFASELSRVSGKGVDADNIRIQQLRVNPTLDTLNFVFNDHNFQYVNSKKPSMKDMGQVQKPAPQPHWMVVDEEKGDYRIPSPDGTKEAFIREDNVWVKDLSTGKETQLSHDGTLGNYYSAWITWSPDSKKVATNRIRPVPKRYVYYVESSPEDQLQPKLHKQEYAKPGDELRFKVPCIFNVETGQALTPSTELFDSQYDIMGPEWDQDSEAITFEYNQRGHQVYRLLEMSATTGDVRTLIEETSDKYVNYPRIWHYDLSDGRHVLWASERDNYNHLYVHDRQHKESPRQVTKGQWYVREVIDVDEDNNKIYFKANGVEKDLDPYFIRYYSIDLDGGNMVDLTPAEGMHNATFSADKKYIIDTYSTVANPPVMVLRDATNGNALMEVAKADISQLLEAGWKAPEPFVAPGRDGKTPMYGLVYWPSDYDPNKKYPIIEYIYQGPGDQYVPKTFYPYNRYMSALPELGFVVVMVDGMGTSFRSREFENICAKNLADAGLPDHMAWIKALAKEHPNLDIDRVGIFGCSAGGQESTNAVLTYPEFYKCAYSACGCHDNRMDKIWWNELWLGYPIDDSYVKASNVENAHKLQVPLMLVVGEMDDNVDPASTMQVVNQLIKHNKDFELVVLPGVHHSMGEDFGEHKRYDFFVKNLLNVDPPKWNEITYPNK